MTGLVVERGGRCGCGRGVFLCMRVCMEGCPYVCVRLAWWLDPLVCRSIHSFIHSPIRPSIHTQAHAHLHARAHPHPHSLGRVSAVEAKSRQAMRIHEHATARRSTHTYARNETHPNATQRNARQRNAHMSPPCTPRASASDVEQRKADQFTFRLRRCGRILHVGFGCGWAVLGLLRCCVEVEVWLCGCADLVVGCLLACLRAWVPRSLPCPCVRADGEVCG